jgi:hydroxymethylbilane synthase
MRDLRIGTRGSRLALWQANHIADLLRAAIPDIAVELVEIETVGDQVREVPLAQIGGEGVFTKAIQDALLDGRADVAVHSLKDLPTIPVEGLVLGGVPARGPTGDVLVSTRHASFAALPAGAVIATSSVRRKAMIRHQRPDLRLADIRGNVETRLGKLEEEELDGLILAQAGLERLGLSDAITELLDPEWMLPAVGQGALGLECRAGDESTRALLQKIDHPATHQAVLAERALLRALGGGCQVPIGAAATIDGSMLKLRGAVLAADGSRRIDGDLAGPLDQAQRVGERLANVLLGKGAREILGI